jgi:hypothetical protein
LGLVCGNLSLELRAFGGREPVGVGDDLLELGDQPLADPGVAVDSVR